MILEIRLVSRKTPGDGRLEITLETARRLRVLAGWLRVRVDDAEAEATISSMTCACAKGGAHGHEHHFLGSVLLKTLRAEETVAVELLEDGVVAVARPHPLGPGEGVADDRP